ncbi:MAG: hypothetical protein MUF10_07950 [Thermoanaerobaculaceae bacterium]|jgi:hypothetical protein|nr:hypothetical protein [Thermoanaerobaculaceae bacterium]
MERCRTIARVLVISLAVLAAVPALAGFSGTDVFLPSVGAKPGVAPAVWYTTVWVHNPNATPANITVYLLERQANLTPLTYTDTIPSGDTKKYENAVQLMFARETFGALRVTSNVKVVVGSRIYSQSGDLDDSVGQYFAGTPASFAIGAGQTTELVGAYGTLPAASSTFRYNYGFVETTGTGTCQVKVTVKDAMGTPQGSKTYALRQWEQLQKGLKDEFPSLSTQNARLTVEVLSGTGKMIAFGSSVANGSQDPATFEMAFRDSLLAENSSGGGLSEVRHDGTLDGTGASSSPLGIADGGVSAGHIASGQVVKSLNGLKDAVTLAAGSNVSITPSGQTLTIAATPGGGGGDITGVAAGGGLTGGGTSGDVTLAVANNGITHMMLAPESVGSGELATAAVLPAHLGAGNPPRTGDVPSFNGGSFLWVAPPAGLTLPFLGTHNGSTAFAIYSDHTAVFADSSEAGGGAALHGQTSGSGSSGVYGKSEVDTGYGVTGMHVPTGHYGQLGTNGGGVHGHAAGAYGILGVSNAGVVGVAQTGADGSAGVLGTNEGAQGVGVWGEHTGSGWGVYGASGSSHAVHGSTSSGVGIYGAAWGSGDAGFFQGNVQVTGTLSKGGGSFRIDHPQDPANRYLAHSFVESPDMMNVYNGNVVTDADGRAVVELPAYFETLNRDFRYQLTVIGRFAQAIVEEEVVENRFVIRTNLAGVKVSWQVTGIRKDPWAEAHRIVVEEDKPEADRGRYLHPELYGACADEGIGSVPEPASAPLRQH